MARTDHGLPGIYNASVITMVDGTGCALAVDVSGITKFNNAYLQAGEDLAADITKIEQRATYQNITADTALKSAAGRFIGFICNSTTSGTIKMYDNTAASGTVILNTFTPAASTVYAFAAAVNFSTGLYADVSNTIDITFLYV